MRNAAGSSTVQVASVLMTNGSNRRRAVEKPAISGGMNACCLVELNGSGASRTMLTMLPDTPPQSVGNAMIAAGAIARVLPPRVSTAATAATSDNGTSATSGATRWRTISSPRSTG